MKRLTFIAMAALLFAACQKEEPTPTPQPQPDPTPTVSLAGTSWIGIYEDNYQGYPAVLTWSLDFLTDSTGELFLDLVVANQQQAPMTIQFTYTFDGSSYGTCRSTVGGIWNFVYNAQDTTITMAVGLNANGGTTLGGLTTFHPRGSNPGTTAAFPEESQWQTIQQVTAGDSTATVAWSLEFWDYATGGALTYRCNGNGTSTNVFWQYDNTTHTGIITLNGAQHPFTYDPATETLTLDYSTTLYGTNVTIGGTLQFHRE